MTKRLVLHGLIGATAVLLAFWVTHWLLSPFPGVSKENFARIRPGMSLKEVEAILGPLSKDHQLWWVDEQGRPDGGQGFWFDRWRESPRPAILIMFDARKRVVSTAYYNNF
jgi:hypothetical protein